MAGIQRLSVEKRATERLVEEFKYTTESLIKILHALKCFIKLDNNLLVTRKQIEELKALRLELLKGATDDLLQSIRARTELSSDDMQWLTNQL